MRQRAGQSVDPFAEMGGLRSPLSRTIGTSIRA